jgi:hypothetical protein
MNATMQYCFTTEKNKKRESKKSQASRCNYGKELFHKVFQELPDSEN